MTANARRLLYVFPGQQALASSLLQDDRIEAGSMALRQFPDGESYIRVLDDVRERDVAILCQLHQPDSKVLALLLLADTLRDLGAARIGLIAPYLAYMRQDRRFLPGEGISAHYFARLLSSHVDWLLTVDPHLHRIHDLAEVYTIAARTLTAVAPIADWIRANVHKPLVIGPDAESEQWAASVGRTACCPWEVLSKQRSGDRDVEVSVPQVQNYLDHTPVLVDDIISTGKTMMQAARHLQQAGLPDAVCIGVHGIFASGAREEMQAQGLTVVTSNSIADASNQIDLAPLLLAGMFD